MITTETEMTKRKRKMTRQGVRDLNGPRMDGRASNGRPPSCAHHKRPDLPTRTEVKIKAIDGELRKVRVAVCTFCGEDRWTELDDEQAEETVLG